MNAVLGFYRRHRTILRPILLVIIAFAGLAFLGMGWTYAQFYSHPTLSNGNKCNLQHIYLSPRLSFRGCKTVSGTVVSIKTESDGDYHALMKVDSRYQPLLTAENFRKKSGNLVIEDVCHFRKVDWVAKTACFNYHSPFPDLVLGQRYEITGNYVVDHFHGDWAEIHGLVEVKPIE